MKQLTNEAFSPEESKKIYDNFLSIIGTRRDKLVKRYGSEAEKVAYAKAVKQVKKQAEEKPKEETMDKTEKLKEEGPKYPELPRTVSRMLSRVGYDKLLDNVNKTILEKEFSSTQEYWRLFREELIKQAEEKPEEETIDKTEKLKEMVKDALKNPKKADLNKDGKLSDYEKKRGAAIEKSMQKEDISESSDMWNKMSDDEKENALLSAVKNPDEALKYLDFAYNDLPSEITQNMRLSEDIDLGHQDDEPGMLKADVYRIGKYAMELYKMLDKFDKMDNEVDFPHWWQSKITKAKSMIVSAKHYLDFEMKEPQIDAMVDVASEEGVIDENKSEYSKIEKKMFNLKQDGKMDTPEYRELIKQRAKLEKHKKLAEAIFAKLKS